MKIFIFLLMFLTVLISFPLSQVFAQLEEIIIERIDIGSTALYIEIVDGKVYVSNPEEGTIVIIDGSTNKIIDTIEAVKGIGILEIVKEKNKIYATALENPLVHVFDLETGEKLKEIDIGQANITLYSKADKQYGQREYVTFNTNAIGLAYNPNNELLYAVHSTVNHVNVIDTNTDTNLGEISVGKTPLLIEIDIARDIAYVTNWETNDVSVIDLKSNKEIKRLATGFVPDQLAIDQDNNRLYVSHHASPQVTVIDLRNQEIESKIQLKAPTHSLSFDPNRSLLHVSYIPESGFTGQGLAGAVEFIDTRTNKVVKTMDLESNPFMVAIDSENDKLYAANIASGTVLAVDLKQEEISLELDQTESPQTTETGGGCLIATATYGSELANQVQFLREVRDNTLLTTASGATFMTGFNHIYYSFSPTIADWERQNPMFKESVKAFITPMISTLSIMQLTEHGSEEQVIGLGISVIALNLGMYVVAPAVAIVKIRSLIRKN